MSFGEGDLHVENERLKEKVVELEADVDRVKSVNGVLCEEINRQERVIEGQRDRIGRLESLLADVWPYVWELRIPGRRDEEFQGRFDELGIEVC